MDEQIMKKCKQCGIEPVLKSRPSYSFPDTTLYHYACPRCGLVSFEEVTEEATRESWNEGYQVWIHGLSEPGED